MILHQFSSPTYLNSTNSITQSTPEDINITHSSFSWVQPNIPAFRYRLIFGLPDWSDNLSNDPRVCIYYMLVSSIFLSTIAIGLASSMPISVDRDNMFVNQVMEIVNLVCFDMVLVYFYSVFPFGVFIAALTGYVFGRLLGCLMWSHQIIVVRGNVVLLRPMPW